MAIDLSCGICLELFTDPRTLPCLHTFCRECLERELNGRETLKCPVCRAKHELNKEGVALLPVDEFARQELPLSKLQNVSLATGSENCESCGRPDPPVAWCDDCKSLICKNCLAQHKMMAILRGHNVVQAEDREKKASSKKLTRVSYCLRHPKEQLKYFCKRCQEAVCCDCLLLGHKEHRYTTVSDTRGTLGEKLEALAKQVSPKKEEFEGYLQKLKEVETSEMESSERMKVEVDKLFDAIVAAVEAQRNKALQTISQKLKEIWAQKELMEMSLAQLDSFTRFTDCTRQCSTDSAYVSMATQGLKLMEQLIDCHGNEGTLEHRLLAIGSPSQDGPLNIPLEGVFQLGQEPTVKLTPPEGSKFKPGEMKITISLEVGGLQVSSMTHSEECELHVDAWSVGSGKSRVYNPEVWRTGQASWEVEFPTAKRIGKYRLKYKLTGAVEKELSAVFHVQNPGTAIAPASIQYLEHEDMVKKPAFHGAVNPFTFIKQHLAAVSAESVQSLKAQPASHKVRPASHTAHPASHGAVHPYTFTERHLAAASVGSVQSFKGQPASHTALTGSHTALPGSHSAVRQKTFTGAYPVTMHHLFQDETMEVEEEY